MSTSLATPVGSTPVQQYRHTVEDEVTLTGDEAVLANRIKTIDRDLDSLEQSIQESVILGLHNSGAAMAANLAQASANKQKEAVLAERAELVTKFKAEVARG